jgi:hypothetical protein
MNTPNSSLANHPIMLEATDNYENQTESFKPQILTSNGTWNLIPLKTLSITVKELDNLWLIVNDSNTPNSYHKDYADIAHSILMTDVQANTKFRIKAENLVTPNND